MPAHSEPAMEPLGIMQSPLRLSCRDWSPRETQQQSALLGETVAPHLLQRAWWPCGGAASGMLGFEVFYSLQGLKTKPPTTKWLVELAEHCQSFLLVLSLCVCVCANLGLPVQAAGASHGWSSPTLPECGATPSPCSSSSGLVTPAQAKICNPGTGGHSPVCMVPLSVSREMPKSQNMKSYTSSITRPFFFSLVFAWESQKFLLRPDFICYPLSHLCIVQPAVMSNGKETLQNYYIKLSYQVASANLKHQGAHTMLLELLPISELKKSNMQLPILTNLYFSSSQATCNLSKHPHAHFKIYHLLHIVGTST